MISLSKFSVRLSLAAMVAFLSCAAVPATAAEVTLRVWGRADPSGPLRLGNLTSAADRVNAVLKAAGSDKTVKIEVIENPSAGWDADALDLLKAFAVGKGPDIFIARHDLLATFVDAGYAANLDRFITDNPQYFDDFIPALFGATRYKGSRWGITQDSEIRQFFFNKDMLRKIGKSEEFIAGLDAKVMDGSFTLQDWGLLTKEVVDKGAAQYGILHRPNVGPEFVLFFLAHGINFQDSKTGELLFPRQEMLKTFEWIKWAVDNRVLASQNTTMSFADVTGAFKQEQAFAYHHGIFTLPWQLDGSFGRTWPSDEAGYFRKIGWLMMPPATKGGRATTLTTPVAYVVSDKSANKDLAMQIVGTATLPYYNTQHAATTFHTPVLAGQTSDAENAGSVGPAGWGALSRRHQFPANSSEVGPIPRSAVQGDSGCRDGTSDTCAGGRVRRQ